MTETENKIPLLDRLRSLKDTLSPSTQPSPAEVNGLLAAVVHYLDTGSVEPLEPEVPAAPLDQRDVELAQLKARLSELENQPASAVGPADVAPAPPNPSDGPDAHPANGGGLGQPPAEATG